ncbi:hypothetical protein KHA96_13275 [Bacillus sp. FJAT-49711]|uniref:hypothetical protein n=1 Tax=Bacillus sp. FJAT-49711 TaxID=2833585 RepID=UPI001BC90711|nr:hypothetical protein [Bacillus sp. FJAT-49711]MBS4219291.1 hypothetical protein [Bacillus sp. FJAT-49711]
MSDKIPIGHFLLKWWSNDVSITQKIDITYTAYSEAGVTIEEYRKMGVATTLIREAELFQKKRVVLA